MYMHIYIYTRLYIYTHIHVLVPTLSLITSGRIPDIACYVLCVRYVACDACSLDMPCAVYLLDMTDTPLIAQIREP